MIVENYARFKEIDEIEEVQKQQAQQQQQQNENDRKGEEEQEAVEKKQERPKSTMELIREKNELLEKNKEKISYLSRSVIGNPQQEVWFY
jgi:FtsZ-interacting cell division protein YlmF